MPEGTLSHWISNAASITTKQQQILLHAATIPTIAAQLNLSSSTGGPMAPPFKWPDRLTIAIDVAEGMDFLHSIINEKGHKKKTLVRWHQGNSPPPQHCKYLSISF